MAKARYTLEADQDLVQIGLYIAQGNPAAALRWVDAIEALCELIAAQPNLGQRVQTRRFGQIRRHVAGNYLIYYRSAADGVEILTVVHGARNQDEAV